MRTIPTDSRNRSDWLGPLLLVVLLIGAAMADWFREPYPLSDAHWDSPIYLLRSKAVANGGQFQKYREGASEIHDAVTRGVYPTPYWSFTRLGQTVLMSSVVGLTGANEGSIHVLAWFYRVVLSIGLFFSAMLPIALARWTRAAPVGSARSSLYLGAVISLTLYLLSDIASYLSGNLVSEVPAIALIGLSTWSLSMALKDRSLPYALLSGGAAFMLYAVRMESVWSYLSFIPALAWLVTRASVPMQGVWKAILISAATAALLFCVYSWVFFPLTDPRLFVSFAEAAAKQFAAEAGDVEGGTTARILKQLVAANGLLWVGGILGLPLIRTSRSFQAGSLWFLLSLVPSAVGMLSGAGTEARMYTTLTPSLFLLSTLGWGNFCTSITARRSAFKLAIVVSGCLLLVLISQPFSYSFLKALPGMWRLQSARQYLAPMPFERIDFHLPELARVHAAIAAQRHPLVIIASPGMQGADHIMVLEYLTTSSGDGTYKGTSAKSGADTPNGSNVQVRPAGVRDDDQRFIASLPAGRLVLLVGTAKEAAWEDGFGCCGRKREVLATEHYSLSELVRNASGRCEANDSAGGSVTCSPQ